LFNIEGKISTLASERDQNVKIVTASGDAYTLKIANESEQPELLELQNSALQHLAGVDATLTVPGVLPSVSGNFIESTTDPDSGKPLAVRLLNFVPGQLYSAAPKTLPLLNSLGDFLGRLSCALQGFAHSAAHRDDFLWNLDNAPAVRQYIEDIDSADDREIVTRIFKRYADNVLPRLPSLRSIIHGDINDNNLVVDASDPQVVCGAFDFGDMAYARQVNELAIAMAYATMGLPDIAAASRELIGAYSKHFPLRETELEVLFDLVEMRLAMSLCISSHRAKQFSDNAYLLVSQKPEPETGADLVAHTGRDRARAQNLYRADFGGSAGSPAKCGDCRLAVAEHRANGSAF